MMSADQNLTFATEDLTAEERIKLSEVMKKAKEFERQEGRDLMRQPLEGLLNKYTNMMKGWQLRWFTLDPDVGRLDYYEKEELKGQKARGSIPMQGATVNPSEEDSQTFTITTAREDVYRLRANDARERQLWVNRLRATAETSLSHLMLSDDKALHKSGTNRLKADEVLFSQFEDVRDMIRQCQQHHEMLVRRIENLPRGPDPACNLDPHLLKLKATSSAGLKCLNNCFNIISKSSLGTGRPSLPLLWTTDPPAAESAVQEEDEDTEVYHDEDVGDLEDQKPLILHLLSQLKLGMDLTKVVLPTVILERRSLLEMFADCMAHPQMFVSISDQATPALRMKAVWEWFMTSFHVGRQGGLAKKPYNPIIGEAFQCSWHVPAEEENIKLLYKAEQVSHHPPVSAFYFECPDKRVSMNASIYTRSRFLGMSIGVDMVGRVSLYLPDHHETYEFGLPSAYARSILTIPWVELGGKVAFSCARTGYSASLHFHTKPFYGGKVHRITGEVTDPSNQAEWKANGEWNGLIDIHSDQGLEKTMDIRDLKIVHKRVPRHQAAWESRKLWSQVTQALEMGDVEKATESKRFLEEQQRVSEKMRRERGEKYKPRFFREEGEGWLYKLVLKA